MKKLNILLATALTALTFASCGIDDVQNVGELSSKDFPISKEDGNAVLAGVYQNLNEVCANPQMSFMYYAQLASDDMLGGGGVNDKLMQAEDLLCNYNADMTNTFYEARYKGINRANTLIDALPNTTMDEATKNSLMGQAKFLRAFYYYELASMYGNVPVRLHPGSETIQQGDITDPWKQILMDLRDAVSLLTVDKEDASKNRSTDAHVDKYAAEAMLGRAWLFYTGFFGNGSSLAELTSTTYNPLTSVELPDGTTMTKDDVISAIDDCVANSGRKLVGDFRNLWAYTNRCTKDDYVYTKGVKGLDGNDLKWVEDDGATNPETLFSIKFNKFASWNTTIGYANGYALHFGVRGGQSYANTFPFGQGWGAGPVAPNLMSDWEAADPQSKDVRRDATVQDWRTVSTYKKGGWADFVQETDYYAKKWAPVSCKNNKLEDGYSCTFENVMYSGNWDTPGKENMQLNNIHDLVIIRFADVLLMQSELKENVEGMNKVHERATGVANYYSSYSLQDLQNERRWELACEGTRWNDIRRWHIAAAALEKQNNVATYYCGAADKNTPHNGGYVARYNATAGFQKMPETQVNMGTVKQNEGWTGADAEYQGWK